MTKQEQLIIILLILAALIGTGLLYHRKFYQTQVTPEVVKTKEWKAGSLREVVVDVKGACWKPGVYTFSYGARVKDAIERASAREDANLDSINLARRLRDGEKIFIPSRNPVINKKAGTSVAPLVETSSGGKININAASLEELEKLPQIGPRIAGYIIAYRNSHGPFREIHEIKNVDKIGESTFNKIKDLITVE